MEYCKYHPLSAATFACPACQTRLCDGCVDDGGDHGIERCFACGTLLESLGSANEIEPFWRRLPQSFRYPMNPGTMTLIIGVSILSTLLSHYSSLISLILWVALTGIMVKYSFLCLQNTANGLLVAPPTGEAFAGGVHLIVNILGILILMSLAVYATGNFLGEGLAATLSVIFTLGLPAVLINYAISEEFAEAINPLNMLRMVTSIGLPYGLLYAFILIMSGSVGMISALIGDQLLLLSAALQSIVFYYYMVVICHLMGYVILQNQAALGFVARRHHGETKTVRPAPTRLLAKVDIQVKEGDYAAALRTFKQALNEYPQERWFNLNCFNFLLATRNVAELRQFAPRYFNFLLASERRDLLHSSYNKLLRLAPDFVPDDAALRLNLASACNAAGHPRRAIKLLIGLPRDHPDSAHLAEGYRLLAQAFDQLPAMEDKAARCRQLAAQRVRRRGASSGEGGGELSTR